MNEFPGQPAVIVVELFRVAQKVESDARRHCSNNVMLLHDSTNNNETCAYCEQWWKPQDWREAAVERSSVARISYRDAVWPELEDPPNNLCQYWYGMSHPQVGTHVLVASTVLFQFLVVMEKYEELMGPLLSNAVAPVTDIGNYACLNPVSRYRAELGKSTKVHHVGTIEQMHH